MVLGSHANTRAMYSTPPWPSLAASMAAYRRRSFSDNHPKKRCIFSSISAEYTSMIDSLSQNLSCYKDTTAQACREVIHDHILRDKSPEPLVWQISLNRRAVPALSRSVPAVKADAAKTLFNVNCSSIGWAVIDSGIHGSHPAFMKDGNSR